MPAARVGFQAYVAAHLLGQLPWKRRHLKLFGPRVTAAAVVAAALKAIFLMAAAVGRLTPDLVGPILKASSQPGGDAYAFGRERALELINPASGQPESYEDLFPDDAQLLTDANAWTLRNVLPFNFSFMLAQVRVVEGLVFGEQYPEVTRELLEAEIREARATWERARAYGLDFIGPAAQRVAEKHGVKFNAPKWERIQDVEALGTEFVGSWIDEAGVSVGRLFELPDE